MESVLKTNPVLTDILQFLEARGVTITILKKIKSEIDVAVKNARHANLATKVVSLGAGITTAVCLVATPLTAGASAPVAAGMAVLSGTSAAVSAGVTVIKNIKESGLMKTASEVIKKDQRAKERFQAAAETLRTLASISSNTADLLEIAAKLGLTITKEVNAVLKLAGTAKATEIATKAANIFGKVNKVAKIAGPVLVLVSIPLDIMGIVADLLENGNESKASQLIYTKVQELQNEYNNVRGLLDELLF
ncbi:uncharacterized protein LOC132747504 [Ruditapes philippinarum]|uniref:uncharacterized protein LOC132747504 n=1 Tax=Ruditapes philippinarum TaxID=129788 RepID=UPI00295AE131|nr:uncharacterized protein LOC132747504 [Ruditapes philippinarum]